ncbi:MAG: hypothetical protein KF789_11340 [Bdellovibrionaceae bacterium]|nr:hypothetical protein [Pseudobdellovibrionaceae bacterium]
MQILSAASSLNPGNDLWILAEPSASRWPLRLDWYLNFQINKASHHQVKKRPDPLNELLSEVDWTLPEIAAQESQPLLISAEGHLPARWIAIVPGSQDVEPWVNAIFKTWKGLGEPSFKVFLPTGLEDNVFSQTWKKRSSFEDFSLVLDQDPRMPVP